MTLEEVDIAGIAEQTLSLLHEGEIPFHRGDPIDYFRRLAKLNAALTLPVVASSALRNVVHLKVVYWLWNLVMDDEIDREGSGHGIDASWALLTAPGPVPPSKRGPAATLLREMARLVPGGSLSRSSPLGYDLCEVIHGLNYELFINKSPRLATSFEYRRNSTMTASLKVLLDIDCVFAQPSLDLHIYRAVREGYDELTCAVKLASDVGTLRREIHDEDNLNLLRILAMASPSHQPSSVRSADVAMEEALRFKPVVLGYARAHLERAREIFDRVPEVGASTVVGAITRIVEVYSTGTDPFFA